MRNPSSSAAHHHRKRHNNRNNNIGVMDGPVSLLSSSKLLFFLLGVVTTIVLLCGASYVREMADDRMLSVILESVTSADMLARTGGAKPPVTGDDDEEEEEVAEQDDSNDAGRRFLPGSLSMSRGDSIQRCHIGTSSNYEEKARTTCLHVPEYGFTFYLLPKNGSSTLRKVMKTIFGEDNVEEKYCSTMTAKQNSARFGVVTRDPLDRFISGYKEVVVARSSVYDKDIQEDRAKKYLPGKYYQLFRDHLDPIKGKLRVRKRKNPTPRDILFNTKLFETFIDEYSGDAFDTHLMLQTSRMWSYRKRGTDMNMNHFHAVMSVDDLGSEMDDLARELGVTPPGQVNARNNNEVFLNPDAISDASIQKLCRILARDYCCLNYELPAACRRNDIPAGERVMCEWTWNENESDTAIKHVFV